MGNKVVHHITPGRSDLNWGKAINELIEGLPEEDWICLRDIDTIPLHHRVFFKQCEDIANNGQFDLVSCMTNRLGVGYQLHGGKVSDNWNIKHHIHIAHELYDKHGSNVIQAPGNIVAGLMMLFSVKTWEDVGMFREGGVAIKGQTLDAHFSKDVIDIGGRIGIAQGIYLFHVYREWASNIRLAQSHFINK